MGALGFGRRRTLSKMWGYLMLVAVLAVLTSVVTDLWQVQRELVLPANPVAQKVSFDLCRGRAGGTCVVDGDTIHYQGTTIRIADIDTPETRSAQCAYEKALGNQATLRLVELLNRGPIEIGDYARDEDRYGRKLRIIMRDGKSLGEMLVAEGLARRWDGARHSWCT